MEQKSTTKKVFKIVGLSILVLVLFFGITEYIYRNDKETPLYKVQQYLTYSKEDWANYENNKRMAQHMQLDTTSVDVVQSAPESPIDTMMWESAIKNNDFIPDGVLDEIKRYKARDFSKLVVAADKPDDKEAQEAIVNHYRQEVINLLKKYKATMKIGTCYNAPLKHGEATRVTAMVSAFNKETGNLGNIQQPLEVIYDFVRYEKTDPMVWHLADFSQNIPFDYKLNSDRYAK